MAGAIAELILPPDDTCKRDWAREPAKAMSGRRHLSDEEQALWSGFARSITSLRRSQASAPPAAAGENKSAAGAAKPRPPVRQASPPPKPPPAPPPPAPLAPLGRRLKQRVARGHQPIGARIDLHGFTQSEAHAALLRFLQRAQADGHMMVLVVTGKGTAGAQRDPFIERGVLRRQVPLWLALPEFRSLVVGFELAHAGHGGQGALYVRLRRRR